jgi:hypothetical protein
MNDTRSPALREQVDILERRPFRSKDVELNRALLTRLVGHADPPRVVLKSALPELNPAP